MKFDFPGFQDRKKEGADRIGGEVAKAAAASRSLSLHWQSTVFWRWEKERRGQEPSKRSEEIREKEGDFQRDEKFHFLVWEREYQRQSHIKR